MTEKEIEKKLQPWVDFIDKHGLDIKKNETNVYETDDLAEYEILYKSYIDSGHIDFFHKDFGIFAQGIGIGAKGGTQLVVNYSGELCDLKNMKVYE